MRTLVLPLDIRASDQQTSLVDEDDVMPMFMPAQWRRVEHDALEAAAKLEDAGIPADDVHGGDIGFGRPRLLRTRVIVDHDGPELAFGASVATLADRPDEEAYWTSAPSTCVSLWETQRILTLTVERLAPTTDDDGITGPLGSDVDQDLLGALRGLLRGTGLEVSFTLGDVFGMESADVFGKKIKKKVREKLARTAVTSFRIASTERVRGRAVTEGFYCVTAPDASDLVADLLVGAQRDDDHDQTTGAPMAWAPLALVNEPAEVGAMSAIRGDSRAALINLESLSVRHEYYGFGGGGMLPAALTYIAHRAEAEHDFGRLLVGLKSENGAVGPKEALDDLERVRLAGLERQLAYQMRDGERFHSWTVPSHLATALLHRTRQHLEQQDDRASEVATVVRSKLEKAQEKRRDKIDTVVRIASPVVTLAGLVGVYAALTTVPNSSSESLLNAMPDAIAATLVIVVVGAVVGGVLEWLKRR